MGQSASQLFGDQMSASAENSTNESTVSDYRVNDKDDGPATEFSRISLVCGSIGDTIDGVTNVRTACIQPPEESLQEVEEKHRDSSGKLKNSDASMLLARALLNQHNSSQSHSKSPATNKTSKDENEELLSHLHTPVKAPVKASSSTRNKDATPKTGGKSVLNQSHIHPLSEQRAQLASSRSNVKPISNTITIGLSLSRRHSVVGHPDTVTRQTAFDFNELQDRSYKFVSSTDCSGWRAGGGESGDSANSDKADSNVPHKVAAPDTVHIPIIQINCEDSVALDHIIAAIARGEVFIPHMSIMPESLSVNGVSPPDLVVRFGCERNDDIPPDQWPNWCLEFIHNQIYELFSSQGAVWSKRPFQLILAKKVRWKTVKHMNQFFAHSEKVINAWREKGSQQLDPQLSYIEGGATPEEVGKPHGIYLLRDGHPTNYFPPNLEPPYTSKMTRSLLLNVLNKSWDRKKRDWSNEASRGITRALDLANPGGIFNGMCGMNDNTVASPTNVSIFKNKKSSIIDEYESIQASVIPPQKASNSSSNLLPSKAEVEKLNHFDEDDDKNDSIISDDNSDHVNLVQSPPESEAGISNISDSYNFKTKDLVQGTIASKEKASMIQVDENDVVDTVESKALDSLNEQIKTNTIESSVAESNTTVGASNLEKIKAKAIENVKKHSSYSERKARQDKHKYVENVREGERVIKAQSTSPIRPSRKDTGSKRRSPAPIFEMEDKGHVSKITPIKQTFSQASMEYSVDSNPSKGGGTDYSVTNGSIFSFATQQTRREGGDESNVPNDDDLRAVGWAKAFDPSSQSYYYYTLDRTKTSWDNPIQQKGEI